MIKCKLCGATGSIQYIKAEEEFERCVVCFGEDCFQEIEENKYYEDKETESRINEWKDTRNE